MSTLSIRSRPLDFNKKQPIVKSFKDFEDDIEIPSNTLDQILGLAAEAAENEVQQVSVKRLASEIPTPESVIVDTYERDYLPNFSQPTTYIHARGARAELGEFVEYDLDNEDEVWLQEINKERKALPAEKLEMILFKLEVLDHKARERAGVVTPTFASPIPVLLSFDAAVEALQSISTTYGVFQSIYSYWKEKRERWQKPVIQPKPKVQVFTQNCHAGIPNSNAKDSDSTDFMDKERPPTCDTYDVIVVSSLGFDHAPPTESTPEVPASEEMPNVDADFPAQHSDSPRIIEDEHNNEGFEVENKFGKKRARKKSKKQTGGEENTDRKRKKANDKTEKATKEKPKKFSHSTRQKRRTVDKVLLETPEDEIDFQRVPIKDLILLAEHKERLTKNAAATSQTPQVNPSVGNSFQLNDEDEAFNFHEDDDAEAFGQQGATELEDTTLYFNYQTYMEKTPRIRWSKEDTELFYEAIQQFGSDFSMIQQLFPGRTRTQVRLKYKKEEQRHPSRIHDALTTRAKDHSHFEEVIKRLKQIAAEENQNGEDIDASFDLTGEEEGQKDEPELENIEENEVQDIEQAQMDEVVEEEEEEEEEEDIWSQYKSEV